MDDVFKKWSNILIKNKPIISDKLASARKTGGGAAEAELTELELKIKVIKGLETFEGNSSITDLSLGNNSPLSDVDLMVTIPTGARILSPSSLKFELEMKPPRKRIFPDDMIIDPVKETVLQNKGAKLDVLTGINSKIEDFAGNVNSKLDRIVNQLELMVSNQNKLIPLLSSTLGCNIFRYIPYINLLLIYNRDISDSNIFLHFLLYTNNRIKIKFKI